MPGALPFPFVVCGLAVGVGRKVTDTAGRYPEERIRAIMRRDATQRRGRILRPGARRRGVVTSRDGRGLHSGNVVHWAVCRLAAEQKVRPLRIVETPAPKKKIREVRGNLEMDETYGLLEGTNPGMAMPVVATRPLWCKRAPQPTRSTGITTGTTCYPGLWDNYYSQTIG